MLALVIVNAICFPLSMTAGFTMRCCSEVRWKKSTVVICRRLLLFDNIATALLSLLVAVLQRPLASPFVAGAGLAGLGKVLFPTCELVATPGLRVRGLYSAVFFSRGRSSERDAGERAHKWLVASRQREEALPATATRGGRRRSERRCRDYSEERDSNRSTIDGGACAEQCH